MSWGELYQVFVDIPTDDGTSVVAHQVYPVNPSVRWTWQKNPDLPTNYDFALGTSIVLADKSKTGRDDFTIIYTEEVNRNRCKEMVLRFVRFECVGGKFNTFYEARFTVADCTFDVERCKVEISPEGLSPFDCITDKWDTEFNLVKLQGFITVPGTGAIMEMNGFEYTGEELNRYFEDGVTGTPLQGPALEAKVVQFVQTHGLYPGADWRPIYVLFEFVLTTPPVGGPDPDEGFEGTWTLTIDWVSSANNPPPPLVFGVNDQPPATTTPQNFSWDWRNQLELAEDGLQNGRRLNDALEDMFNQIADSTEGCELLQLRSDFFGINADGTAPLNSYYAFAQDNLQNLAYFPAHDIAKTDETQASFRIEYTFEDVLKDLQAIFNVKFWKNDQAGGSWRIEHVSYGIAEPSAYQMDLTQPEHLQYIRGKWQYSYDKPKIPDWERWTWATERRTGQEASIAQGDFESADIQYLPECVGKEANTVNRTTRVFFTDFSLPVNNSDLIGSKLFLLVALDGSDEPIITPGFNSGFSMRNSVLGFPYLQDELWKIQRPLSEGIMNGTLQAFEYSVRLRQQVPIYLPMCCEDFVAFNPWIYIKTQLGWGEVEQAEYEEPTNRMTLNLSHD